MDAVSGWWSRLGGGGGGSGGGLLLGGSSLALAAVAVTLVVFVAYYYYFLARSSSSSVFSKQGKVAPPTVPYRIPFLGSMLEFGKNPPEFLQKNAEKYGEVFTFKMFGRNMTYFTTPESCDAFFNAKEGEVSAKEAYASLTVPVFGKGVIYDCPHNVMVEQKKMAKPALVPEAFDDYVPIIVDETVSYLNQWGDSGQVNIRKAMAELTIMTASHCLLGPEVRARLNVDVAQLYHDLDNGFTPLNFLFPSLPLPSYRKRDLAHIKMRQLFLTIIQERRRTGKKFHDLLQVMMDSTYKSGEKLTDTQVAHFCIAVLMAGQHTSSTTGAWMSLFLARDAKLREKVVAEQKEVFGDDLSPLDFMHLKKLQYMECVLKETLRQRPPIITMMRKVMTDQTYKNYTIPAGNYICASQAINHFSQITWDDPDTFLPERYAPEYSNGTTGEEKANVGGRFGYFPFGAGRHRCIGEAFAYLQLKTIISTLIRMYDFELAAGFPQRDFNSLVVLPKGECLVRYKRRAASH